VSEETKNRNLHEHAGITFSPVHQPCRESECTALYRHTDTPTDRRQDYANSRSYRVCV